MPPIDITTAPTKNPIATWSWLPLAIRWPKRSGPTIPPAAVPTA
jgi:hypothetical protein